MSRPPRRGPVLEAVTPARHAREAEERRERREAWAVIGACALGMAAVLIGVQWIWG